MCCCIEPTQPNQHLSLLLRKWNCWCGFTVQPPPIIIINVFMVRYAFGDIQFLGKPVLFHDQKPVHCYQYAIFHIAEAHKIELNSSNSMENAPKKIDFALNLSPVIQRRKLIYSNEKGNSNRTRKNMKKRKMWGKYLWNEVNWSNTHVKPWLRSHSFRIKLICKTYFSLTNTQNAFCIILR